MAPSPSLVSSVSAYVTSTGHRLVGRQALARWSRRERSLSPYSRLGDLAQACRDGGPAAQDRLLRSLLAVAGDDQLAQLVVVAGLSRRLAGAVSAWRRRGARGWDLAALEADLVSSCWSAVAEAAVGLAQGGALPERLGLYLLDEAHRPVRSGRRRELRAAGRQLSLAGVAEPSSEDGAPCAEQLAREIEAAVRAGRISVAAARPVFLTRVAGYSTAEAGRHLGYTPAVVRAVRSRAERALVA